MRFWWEGIDEKEWKKNIRYFLRNLSKEESRLNMLKRRRQFKELSITSNISSVGIKKKENDPVGDLIISLEELDEKIRVIELHLNDIKDAILPLPIKYKEMIQYRYFERKTYKEVGNLLCMELRCLEAQDLVILKTIKENLTETFLW